MTFLLNPVCSQLYSPDAAGHQGYLSFTRKKEVCCNKIA
ncbi:hypothetical protein Q7O_004140 [Pectobacterium carotovorum subsp. carotovorum PCCS1]|nr:hypothetical protein [Pectobacterium carotovorum subsp. carotovorum PCCS1]